MVEMEQDTTALFEQLRTLVGGSRDQGLLIQEELGKLLPKAEEEEAEETNEGAETAEVAEVTKALTKMKLSQVTKLRKYNKGENFSRFCERFKEYIYITKIKDQKLYLFLLQNVDDETYSTLKSVHLEEVEMRDEEKFCEAYKKVIYGDEGIHLKSEVMDCKQQSDEDVSDFAYRLKEKASIAFDDQNLTDEACLLSFVRGVKDTYIRRKLNEGDITDFNDALKLAKKLEKVDKMLNDRPKKN